MGCILKICYVIGCIFKICYVMGCILKICSVMGRIITIYNALKGIIKMFNAIGCIIKFTMHWDSWVAYLRFTMRGAALCGFKKLVVSPHNYYLLCTMGCIIKVYNKCSIKINRALCDKIY